MIRELIFRKTGHLLPSLFLILFGLCGILLPLAREDIIKSGNCLEFFENGVTETGWSAPHWSVRQNGGMCFVCNAENSKKSWFYTKFFKTDRAKSVHVKITMQFASCPPCRNQYAKVFVLQEHLPTKISSTLTRKKLNNLPLSTKINGDKQNTPETYHFQYFPNPNSNSRESSLVFLAEGACVIISKIEVSSFYCPKTLAKGFPLPKTVSPASGTLRVNSSCPKNSVSHNGEVFGLCRSDGEWADTKVTPCTCKKGFVLEKNVCKVPRPNLCYYKGRVVKYFVEVGKNKICICKQGKLRCVEEKACGVMSK